MITSAPTETAATAKMAENAEGDRMAACFERLRGENRAGLVAFITATADDSDADLLISNMPRYQVVKLSIDDLREFYFEAALAQPGLSTDVDLANWYYGENVILELLVNVNSVCAGMGDAILKKCRFEVLFQRIKFIETVRI